MNFFFVLGQWFDDENVMYLTSYDIQYRIMYNFEIKQPGVDFTKPYNAYYLVNPSSFTTSLNTS